MRPSPIPAALLNSTLVVLSLAAQACIATGDSEWVDSDPLSTGESCVIEDAVVHMPDFHWTLLRGTHITLKPADRADGIASPDAYRLAAGTRIATHFRAQGWVRVAAESPFYLRATELLPAADYRCQPAGPMWVAPEGHPGTFPLAATTPAETTVYDLDGRPYEDPMAAGDGLLVHAFRSYDTDNGVEGFAEVSGFGFGDPAVRGLVALAALELQDVVPEPISP